MSIDAPAADKIRELLASCIATMKPVVAAASSREATFLASTSARPADGSRQNLGWPSKFNYHRSANATL